MNDNAVGDCKSGQFWQVRVCTERDEACAVSLQICWSRKTLVTIHRMHLRMHLSVNGISAKSFCPEKKNKQKAVHCRMLSMAMWPYI